MIDMGTSTQELENWYSAAEAARRLSERSGKQVRASYLYKLLEYGKIRSIKVGGRCRLYYKPDVDAYLVEERGKKLTRATRQAARRKPREPGEYSPLAWDLARRSGLLYPAGDTTLPSRNSYGSLQGEP